MRTYLAVAVLSGIQALLMGLEPLHAAAAGIAVAALIAGIIEGSARLLGGWR